MLGPKTVIIMWGIVAGGLLSFVVLNLFNRNQDWSLATLCRSFGVALLVSLVASTPLTIRRPSYVRHIVGSGAVELNVGNSQCDGKADLWFDWKTGTIGGELTFSNEAGDIIRFEIQEHSYLVADRRLEFWFKADGNVGSSPLRMAGAGSLEFFWTRTTMPTFRGALWPHSDQGGKLAVSGKVTDHRKREGEFDQVQKCDVNRILGLSGSPAL